jgi:hypothetical protein
MIRLIGIDFDGTLLNSDKKISKENKEAIKKAIKKGVIVSIFTGRSYPSAINYIKELNLDVPCVFQNGALIMKPLSEKIINEVCLEKEKALEVCEYLEKEDKVYTVFSDFFETPDMIATSRIYSSQHIQYFENNMWRTRIVKNILEELRKLEKKEVVQIAFLSEKEFMKKMKTVFSDLSIIASAEINGEYFVEIFGNNIGKEKALHYLEDYYEISAEETMFIGDSFNDLEIIKKVGYGVAMGNAKDEVKKAAKFITFDNNSNGVAHILEKMILK